jgi:hypothetical protein
MQSRNRKEKYKSMDNHYNYNYATNNNFNDNLHRYNTQSALLAKPNKSQSAFYSYNTK